MPYSVNVNGKESRILAAMSYLPLLGVIPILLTREDEFSVYHAKQGLILLFFLIVSAGALWVINLVFSSLFGQILVVGFIFKIIAWLINNLIGVIIGFLYLFLVIVGIIYSLQGHYWQIPFVSTIAQRIKIR